MARWETLPAPEIRRLASDGAVVVWPIGSTEQHGAHLVSGFDLAAAEAIATRASSLADPHLLLVPGLPFGASRHWLALGATISLTPQTLSAVVGDVANAIAAAGFRHLVILNGHAGNVAPSLSALAAVDVPAVEFVSYWDLVDGHRLAELCSADGGGIGHAGEVETSVGLYLDEERLVVRERIANAQGLELDSGPGSAEQVFIRPPRPLEESPTGVYGDPRPARAEVGQFVVEGAARALADHCLGLYQASNLDSSRR
jgi:creatinine amidohydrolase